MDEKCTIPNDLMREYYEQRSSGGLIITEATAISQEGHGWRNAPQIINERHAAGWKKVVEAVHAKEGLIYLQLWHMGRQAHSSFHPATKRIVGPSPIPMTGKTKNSDMEEVEPEVPHALTLEEIEELKKDYVKAAHLAKKAGFDGVEIHSANGYLMDEFLQSCSNQRTDKYGGSPENRVRLLAEVVEAIIADGSYPANRIGFRLSPNGAFGGMGSEDNPETFTVCAQTMNKYGLAYLHLMDGTGFGYHGKAPVMTAVDFRKVFDGPILCNVGLTRDIAEGMIRSGACDVAVFGRLYISNPDLPERFANDWPVAEPAPYETWWKPTGAEGYTDWAVYEPKVDEEQEEKKVELR
jgi:N-ethylmaleimide reductase